jgi:hypothetical protein
MNLEEFLAALAEKKNNGWRINHKGDIRDDCNHCPIEVVFEMNPLYVLNERLMQPSILATQIMRAADYHYWQKELREKILKAVGLA